MTTIIAIQKRNEVLFGTDAQVTAGNRISKHPLMAKIVERGPYIIAGSGEVAASDIIQHIWTPPTPKGNDWNDLYHFVISTVVPSMKQCFKDNEYKWNEVSEDDDTRFSFLLAVGGTVFEISDDFSVGMDSTGYYGIGSGSDYAVGALHAGADMEEALKIAARLDAFTSPPFYYFTQPKRETPKKPVK